MNKILNEIRAVFSSQWILLGILFFVIAIAVYLLIKQQSRRPQRVSLGWQPTAPPIPATSQTTPVNFSLGSIILAVLSYAILWFLGLYFTVDGGERWWQLSIILVLCHIVMSTKYVNERELGALFFLGRPVQDLDSGPIFSFWPFYYVKKETRNVIQIEVGVLTDKEKEKAKELESSASVFMFDEPFFLNWGDLNSAEYASEDQRREEREKYKNNPLAKPLVTHTRLTIRFRIQSLTHLIDQGGSLPEAIELIQKAGRAALISYAGKSFVARALGNMDQVDAWLLKKIEEFVYEPQQGQAPSPNWWGVNVEKTQITGMGTARRVSEAQADQAKTLYTAQADEERLKAEGRGKADSEKLLQIARAEGAERLAQLAETDTGKLVLQLQALERALSQGKAVVIPLELSRIANLLSPRI